LPDLQRLNADLEVKAVDTKQRIIEGYAAVFGNLDRHGDIIEPKAFDRTLKESPDVAVFVGHNMAALPVGEPLEMRADEKGLFTRTKVYKTSDGDALLEVAKARLDAGKTLGMSIGYRTINDNWQKQDGVSVRHLLDVDLAEYSYLASPNFAANPEASVVATKRREDKAQWDTAYINNLPASSFAYIEPGGSKDDEGKTIPRESRHFPHHDAEGNVDLPHLRNALARAPQSPFGAKALPHLERHAKAEGVGKGYIEDAIDALTDVMAEIEAKSGRVMSQKNLDRVHEAMTGLGMVHGGTCDMDQECPMEQKAEDPPEKKREPLPLFPDLETDERKAKRAEMDAALAKVKLA